MFNTSPGIKINGLDYENQMQIKNKMWKTAVKTVHAVMHITAKIKIDKLFIHWISKASLVIVLLLHGKAIQWQQQQQKKILYFLKFI